MNPEQQDTKKLTRLVQSHAMKIANLTTQLSLAEIELEDRDVQIAELQGRLAQYEQSEEAGQSEKAPDKAKPKS